MPSERVTRAVAHLKSGKTDLGPLLDLTADELNEVIASVRWGYATAAPMKDAVQNLYEQRRAEEAERRAEPREVQAIRLSKWQLVVAVVSAFLTGIGVTIAGLVAWKQLHPHP